MVTNHLSYLSSADQIVYMRDGTIHEQGTYGTLMKNGSAFYDLMREMTREEARDDDQKEEKSYDGDDEQGTVAVTAATSTSSSASSQSTVIRTNVPKVPTGKTAEQRRADGKLMTSEKRNKGLVRGEAFGFILRESGVGTGVLVLLGLLISQGCIAGTNFWLAEWSKAKVQPVGNHTGDGTVLDPSTTWHYVFVCESWKSIKLFISKLNEALSDAIIILASALFQGLASIGVAYARVNASRGIHASLMKTILRAPTEFFDVTPIGRILNRWIYLSFLLPFLHPSLPLSFPLSSPLALTLPPLLSSIRISLDLAKTWT